MSSTTKIANIPPRHKMPSVIIGLDQMALHFGRTRQTIANWIRLDGFPAARLPDGMWCTTPSLVDSWLLARNTLGLEAMDEELGPYEPDRGDAGAKQEQADGEQEQAPNGETAPAKQAGEPAE